MRQKIIYESILDNMEETDVDSASVASNSISNSTSTYNQYFDICIRNLYTENLGKSGLKVSQIRELNAILTAYASTLTFFDDFSVMFSMSQKAVSAHYDEFLSCDDFISKCIEENNYLTNWSAVTASGSVCIRIYYSMYPGNTFKMYTDAVLGLLRVVWQVIFERFKFRSPNANTISIVLSYEGNQYEFNVKNLDYDELKAVYSNMLGSQEGNEWKNAKYNVVHRLNTEGVRLSPDVMHDDVTRLKPGDLIYFRKNHGLVLKQKSEADIPVAQFVYRNQNDDSLRCVSLRFMSQLNPRNGSIRPCERISFGNFDNTIITDGIISTSDGLEITDATIKYINSMERQHIDRRPKFYQYDLCEWGNMPLFEITMQFRTPGTKPGDWYVPAADELKIIRKNLRAFDEIRKQNDIEEFPEWEYATSLEIDNTHRVVFDMDLGAILDDRSKKGNGDQCAIAFLKIAL